MIPISDDVRMSPRKKQKTSGEGIAKGWPEAVAEMMREKEEDDDDDLPNPAFAFNSGSLLAAQSPRRMKGKGKQRLRSDSEDEDDASAMIVEDERWSPPPPDYDLDIPGELVLAKEKGTFWPAKVLEYIPPVKRTQKQGKYRIRWLDMKERHLYRSQFYTSAQDEFGTCKVRL